MRVRESEWNPTWGIPSISFTRNKAPPPKFVSDSERIEKLELEIVKLKEWKRETIQHMEDLFKKYQNFCDEYD